MFSVEFLVELTKNSALWFLQLLNFFFPNEYGEEVEAY